MSSLNEHWEKISSGFWTEHWERRPPFVQQITIDGICCVACKLDETGPTTCYFPKKGSTEEILSLAIDMYNLSARGTDSLEFQRAREQLHSLTTSIESLPVI